MGQAVFHKFPSAIATYEFHCRNEVDLTPYKEEIEKEIKELCKLRFTGEELDYLKSIRFLSSDYIHFLRMLQLQEDCVKVSTASGKLTIQIHGPWFTTIYFEVPVLAIVNEIYSRSIAHCGEDEIPPVALDNLIGKIGQVGVKSSAKFRFADFGTRRRFSVHWQDYLIGRLKEDLSLLCPRFTGTSNVMFAMKHDVKPIGTMAHEFIQACQGFVKLRDSQKFALQSWADEFRGKLGVALSDTVGFDAFLRDFDLYFAKLYDGVRQDSGDPYVIAEKLIAHYEKLGIDPKTKVIVFSDGLDFGKAIALDSKFRDRINTSFGIGTNLTNDCGVTPLQIVIKLTHINGQPVAKLSDSPGKAMCKNQEYLNYLKGVFEIKENNGR
jgi:nicotinate phosphoribosyltransferase